jgi:hypothetical protein
VKLEVEKASHEANEDRPSVDPQYVVKVQLTGGGRVDVLETALVEPPPSVVSEAIVATTVDDTAEVNPLVRSS